VLLTGKRKPALWSNCDQKRLEKHILDWNELIKAGA
jgi:hypothetical protein